MTDEPISKSWWQTLPGIIASITAGVTALSGLVVALKQTGWFERAKPPVDVVQHPRVDPATPAKRANPPQAPNRTDTPAQPRTVSVPLPEMHAYKLGPATGKATFTLLEAKLIPQTTEKNALQIRVRMMNHDRYDKNFWDDSFRLLIGDVPAAPESNLNELVPGNSAREGVVMFSIPRATPAATLKITYYNDSTEIPLDLAPTR